MGTTSEKLTYLNTTKEKIRDSINLTGANIGTSDTFRSYASKLKKGYIDIINNGIDTLYNNFPKVSGIGSNLSLTPTYEAPMKLNEIQGDTLQNGTPTPDSPVPIQSVTGLQNVEVCGKNLITTYNYASSGYINYNYDNSKIGKTMTYSFIPNFSTTNATLYIRANTSISSYNVGTISTITSGTKVSVTFTLTDEQYNTIKNTTGGYIQIYKSGVSMDENSISNPMLEINNQATSYEPYKGNTYEVNLGKNLFDINGTFTGNLIKYNNGFKLIKNSTNRTINYLPSSPIPKGTYTLSYEIVSSTLSDVNKLLIQFFNADNTNILTKTLSSTGSLNCILTEDVTKIYFYISNSEETDTQITFDNIQLEKGTQSTSFSPYFRPIKLNHIPNTDYEDSIKKSNGKNLFDKDNANILNAIINGTTGNITAFNTCRTAYIQCKPNTTYTISRIAGTRFIVGTTTNIPTIGSVCNQKIGDNTVTSITITTGANDNYLCVFYYNSGSDTLTEEQIRNSIMIQEGSIVSPYEPYGKVWYIEKNIGKVVLNGSETYETTGTNTSGKYKIRYDGVVNLIKRPANANTIGDIISNQFIPLSASDTYRCSQGISVEISGKISFYDETLTQSTSAFKTWLESNNMTIYYGLQTPEITEITNTELIEDLETLYTAKSQEGTTNISITSEDLEMILNVSALKGDA